MYKVVSVDFNINVEEVTNIQLNNSSSFLDADILLLNSSTQEWVTKSTSRYYTGVNRVEFSGRPDVIRGIYKKRKYEVQTLLQNGKIIFVLLSPIFKFGLQYAHESFTDYSNYSWLPDSLIKITDYMENGRGVTIETSNTKTLFTPLYKAFKDEFEYKSYFTELFESKIFSFSKNDFVLRNNTGNIVGFSKKYLNGIVVFLPSIKNSFNPEKLFGVLLGCAKQFLGNNVRTIEPEWSKEYILPGESEILLEKEQIQSDIDKLNIQMSVLNNREDELLLFRALLYEQGKPLENAVAKCFELMGFSVSKYEDNDMEHDVVLVSSEGRIIGEIEGKDNDSINISKLDQLTRVVDEDFHKTGVYPEGVLIGNAHRLTKPCERPHCFTEKVFISAERKKFGLLNTIELFSICLKLLENQSDQELKEECRKKMFSMLGSEIKFS